MYDDELPQVTIRNQSILIESMVSYWRLNIFIISINSNWMNQFFYYSLVFSFIASVSPFNIIQHYKYQEKLHNNRENEIKKLCKFNVTVTVTIIMH